MSLLGEYVSKQLTTHQIENELQKLIGAFNKKMGTDLLVYATAFKKIPDSMINQDDYFIIHDILKSVKSKNICIYVETPGGQGEAVEEIVRCLRTKFEHVSFFISGEAKSAGTILVLSGDEIYMTESGSLGPIDAQVSIGRMVVSAYDYMEWVDSKRQEAIKNNALNPFDATMIAQISPGELNGVNHALQFAQDLIIDWLPKYKFKDWNETEKSKKPIEYSDKVTRAKEIASQLVDHSKWRSHGRSIKIDDLQSLLKINKIDNDPILSDLIYRIQTLIKILFQTTSVYKVFATVSEKIFRHATPITNIQRSPLPLNLNGPKEVDVVQIQVPCNSCKKMYNFYGKFKNNSNIDRDLKSKGLLSIIENRRLKCECGNELELSGIINDIESKARKKLV